MFCFYVTDIEFLIVSSFIDLIICTNQGAGLKTLPLVIPDTHTYFWLWASFPLALSIPSKDISVGEECTQRHKQC